MRLAFLADHRGVEPDVFPATFVDQTRSFIARHHEAGTLRSWLAETDRCVGVVSMLLLDLAPRPDDLRTGEGYIINMYVEPQTRRQGVGRALLGACFTAVAELDLRRLVLDATAAGRPMYASNGFVTNDDWMERRFPPSG